MPQLSDTYDFGLVLVDVGRDFDAARRVLARLRDEFATDELRGIDLLFEPPQLLLCLLRFDMGMFGPDLPERLLVLARAGGFRLLELMRISRAEQAAFYEYHMKRFKVRELGVVYLDAALARIASRVGPLLPPAPRSGVASSPVTLSLTFPDEQSFLKRLGKDPEGAGTGMFVPSQAMLEMGQPVRLAIRVGTGAVSQGPIGISARVTYVVDDAQADEQRGYGVGFLMLPEEANLFESFLVAVRRGSQWPERSGRRFERFPVRLRAEYEDHEGKRRIEFTNNLGRGGLFLDSFDPPPIGSVLQLRLWAPGGDSSIELRGKVMHALAADAAAVAGAKSGAGIRFLEPADAVNATLLQLLGRVALPTRHRALIVDDDRFFRTILGNTLRLGGFEVLEASNGDEAFARLLEQLMQLDVMVLDLYMPGLSGTQLLHKIRRVGGELDLAIVVLTGSKILNVEQEVIATMGADAILEKSCSPEEVLETIETVLEKRQRPGSPA